MDLSRKRLRIWLLFYAVMLAVCAAGVLLLSLFIPIGSRFGLVMGIWLMLDIFALNVPDHIWDRWIVEK